MKTTSMLTKFNPWQLALAVPLFLGAATIRADIVKCELDGKISYSDTTCAPGQTLAVSAASPTTPSRADLASANKRAAAEKAELKAIEIARKRAERMEEKQQQRDAAISRTHRKKCDALANKKKWLDDEARTASGRSAIRIKQDMYKLGQKQALECAT